MTEKATGQSVQSGALLALYRQFYAAWNRCESNRGCYSCADPHDCRCERQMEGAKQRGETPVCECGRDELEKLETQIDEAEANARLHWPPGAAAEGGTVRGDVRD